MKTKVILGLILVLILIQFFQIDKTNPPIDSTKDFEKMETLHSHETTFPSYTKVQPLGWFVRSHVRGGRINLNFSEWGNYTSKQKSHKLQECVEVIEQGRMPMKSYTWMHPNAKLSDKQQSELIELFRRLSK